jgi:hypothetical protein
VFDDLDEIQIEALRRMVREWVGEGFTTPPYEDAYYDIFAALGIKTQVYDIERPKETP